MKTLNPFFLVFLASISTSTIAQVPFSTLIGEEAQSYTESVYHSVPTSDGGVIAAIRIGEDHFIMKLDADGQPLWSNSYTTDLADPAYVQGILATSDGGAYAIVDLVTHISGMDPVLLFVLVRLDANGAANWSKRFTTSADDTYLFSSSMALLQNNDLQLTWYGLQGAPEHTLRISANGELQWAQRQTQGGSLSASFWHDIHVDDDNGVTQVRVAHGNTWHPISITRWTADGAIMWNKTGRITNGDWDYYHGKSLQSASGDIYIHGRQFAPPSNDYPFLVKVSPAGTLEWWRLYGNGTSETYLDEHSATELPNTNLRFGALGRSTFTTDGDHVSSVRILPPVWTSGSFSYSFPVSPVLGSLDGVLVRGSLSRVDNVFATTWTTPFLSRIDLNDPLDCGWVEDIDPLMTDTIVPSDFIDYSDDTPWTSFSVSVADTTVFVVPFAPPTIALYCAPVGIQGEHSTQNGLTLFPSVAQTGLSVIAQTPAAGSLILWNDAGQCVRTEHVSAGSNTLSTDDLARGIYSVQLIRNDHAPSDFARLVIE